MHENPSSETTGSHLATYSRYFEAEPGDLDSANLDLERDASPRKKLQLEMKKDYAKRRNTNPPWTAEDDALLRHAVDKALMEKRKIDWKQVSLSLNSGKSSLQCAQRWKRVIDPQLNKGPWEIDEEVKLLELAQTYPRRWAKMSAGLQGTRCDIQCRYWYLKLEASQKLPFSPEEDQSLRKVVTRIGTCCWSQICSELTELKLCEIRFGKRFTVFGRTPLEYQRRWDALQIVA